MSDIQGPIGAHNLELCEKVMLTRVFGLYLILKHILSYLSFIFNLLFDYIPVKSLIKNSSLSWNYKNSKFSGDVREIFFGGSVAGLSIVEGR